MPNHITNIIKANSEVIAALRSDKTAVDDVSAGDSGSGEPDMQNRIHILSLGAGVQSSCLALMAAHGKVPNYPALGGAIFADTQDEPESVYSWLNWLEAEIARCPFPFPVHRVTAGKLSLRSLDMRTTEDGRRYSRTDIPFYTRNHDGSAGRVKNRSCTRDFKIKPIMKKARKMANVPRKSKSARVHVVQWIGISVDEIYRMKPSRDWWAESVWPLVDLRMNRHDCKQWMNNMGYPEPPRSSCVFCPFHNNHEWRRLRDDEPESFRRAVEFERAVQRIKGESQNFRTAPFLHRSLRPLDQVDFRTDADHGQGNLFNNECEGMCGV